MSEDLLFNLADSACVRAWEDEGWGPVHKKLLQTCLRVENSGWANTRKRKEASMTQHQKLIRHFNKHGSITQREALLDYNISRLASRVHELRVDYSMPITSVIKHNPVTGTRYVRYYYGDNSAKINT